jgi:hypothetical protein
MPIVYQILASKATSVTFTYFLYNDSNYGQKAGPFARTQSKD